MVRLIFVNKETRERIFTKLLNQITVTNQDGIDFLLNLIEKKNNHKKNIVDHTTKLTETFQIKIC